MNKKRTNASNRMPLTLYLALVVFIFNTVAQLIATALVYLGVRLDILDLHVEFINYFRLFAITAVISLVIGFILSTLLGRFPLSPVNRLINALNTLADGDYSVRLHYLKGIFGIETYRDVIDTFNKLAEELENTEMLRSDFINDFSHEFKTPIVSIAGFAKILRSPDLTVQERDEYLKIIEDESRRLSVMASNILNLTRIEKQTILTNVSEYNLSEQIRTCILILEPKWSARNVEFDLQFDEYNIFANEEVIKQVWLNLIDNAVKFSPEYGTVKISITQAERVTTVAVLNSGPDISPEDQARIFNKFYQADSSHSTQGNGIGLAIVKKAVTLHHGDVTVKSDAGLTEFTVTIPDLSEYKTNI